MKRMTNADIREMVTAKIVEALEHGVKPWRKGWHGAGSHHNAVSGHVYTGINPMYLEACRQIDEFESTSWLTFNQTKSTGGSVKKGAKATWIVFTKPLTIREKDDETGKEIEKRIQMLRVTPVFNLDQTEGVKLPKRELEGREPVVRSDTKLVRDAMELGELNSADIRLQTQNRAYFNFTADHIVMPQPEQFKTAESFAATLLHELTHWTGHSSRLDREYGASFGDSRYAFEELIAEIGAASLCAKFDIDSDLENHASYVSSWLGSLKRDSRYVFQAARLAQEAVTFLAGDVETDMKEAA